VQASYTKDELAKVRKDAKTVKLSVSEYLRRLSLGNTIPDPKTFAYAALGNDILKVNADLARLGNLQKLVLDLAEDGLTDSDNIKIMHFVDELNSMRGKLNEVVDELYYQIHPRKRP